MSFRVDPGSQTPPSRQLVVAVLNAIARGDLGPSERLPSVRAMAGEALVNPNTVGKAYRELEHLGVVAGKNGSGVFVTDAGPRLARAERGEATLDALRAAVVQALQAGHDKARLRAVLKQALNGSKVGGRR